MVNQSSEVIFWLKLESVPMEIDKRTIDDMGDDTDFDDGVDIATADEATLTPEQREELIYYREVGDRIRTLRKRRDLTLREMASAIGKGSVYIGNIERAKKRPSGLKIIRDIAECLGTTPGYLLGSPGVRNSEQNPDLRLSDSALRAAHMVDKLPAPMRKSLLTVVEEYSSVLGALAERQRDLLRYQIAAAEKEGVDLANIKVDDRTVGQFLDDVFTRRKGID